MDAKFQAFIDIRRLNYVDTGKEKKTEREREGKDVIEIRWKAFSTRVIARADNREGESSKSLFLSESRDQIC